MLRLLVPAVLALLLFAPTSVVAQAAPAHVVMVSAPDEAAATALLARYRSERLTSVGETYPMVTNMGTHWALLVAAPTDASVADALVTYLQAHGWDEVSSLAGVAGDAQDVGVLVIASDGPIGDESWQYVGPVHLLRDSDFVGQGQPSADNAVVILYPWTGPWAAPGTLTVGGSAEFPYECEEWQVPAASEAQRVLPLTLGVTTANCFGHGG